MRNLIALVTIILVAVSCARKKSDEVNTDQKSSSLSFSSSRPFILNCSGGTRLERSPNGLFTAKIGKYTIKSLDSSTVPAGTACRRFDIISENIKFPVGICETRWLRDRSSGELVYGIEVTPHLVQWGQTTSYPKLNIYRNKIQEFGATKDLLVMEILSDESHYDKNGFVHFKEGKITVTEELGNCTDH